MRILFGNLWRISEGRAPFNTTIANNVPAFIREEDWTSGSLDLNPLIYELWDTLEQNTR